MNKLEAIETETIQSVEAFAKHADFSLIETLTPSPDSKTDGIDHDPREIKSGHYILVKPTPLPDPEYLIHSKALFSELGLDDALAKDQAFIAIFSGDLRAAPEPMMKVGWATGYALSIYGTEYTSQCPFGTGNGYGDGRAISIFEGVFKSKRWEFQLKGGGRTPYCRGADGKAVLRSSIREFLASEHMHALGIPTTGALTLYRSQTQTTKRPWYKEGSRSYEPDVVVDEPTAITTRVASSFLRVGQLELFARRAKAHAHPNAQKELEEFVKYAMWREYGDEIDMGATPEQSVLAFARAFAKRLTKLVADWIRVGYVQGNFNSDNCAIGGFTLDYGPYGFCELFDPAYQPWTGGGKHFSFFNQPNAAYQNYLMFCKSLEPLLKEESQALEALEQIKRDFGPLMRQSMERMWAVKLGLKAYDEELFRQLMRLMVDSDADYTMLFRELSTLPTDVEALERAFYASVDSQLAMRWNAWLKQRNRLVFEEGEPKEEIIATLKRINPKYILREWQLMRAYKEAQEGDSTYLFKLYEVTSSPYEEQEEYEEVFYRLRPPQLFGVGGIEQISCSS